MKKRRIKERRIKGFEVTIRFDQHEFTDFCFENYMLIFAIDFYFVFSVNDYNTNSPFSIWNWSQSY